MSSIDKSKAQEEFMRLLDIIYDGQDLSDKDLEDFDRLLDLV